MSAKGTDRLYKALTADLAAEAGVTPVTRPPCPRCGVTVHRRLDGKCRQADIFRKASKRGA